jgi:hypothetical protein
MSKCPICDFPSSDVQGLLARLQDSSLLVNLACDFAGRVVNLVPDPACATAWLDAARGELTEDEALRIANEAKEAFWEAESQEGKITGWPSPRVWAANAIWSVCTACVAVAGRREARQVEAVKASVSRSWAIKAAEEAAKASGRPSYERAWQLKQIASRACICVTLIAPNPTDPRLRTSLLAS